MDVGSLHARPLGQLLVERDLLSREQLEDALLEQRKSRKRLGSILVDTGIVTPEDLSAALRAQIREIANHAEAGMRDDEPSRGATVGKRRLFRRQPRAAEDSTRQARGSAKLQDLIDITEEQNDLLRQELSREAAELELARALLAQRDSRIIELETRLTSLEQEKILLARALREEIRELESALRSLRSTASAST